MSRLTPEQVTQKHADRMKGSISDMQMGIERLTVSPTSQAAAKKDKMLQNLTAKVQDGTWEKRLRAVTLEDWRKKTIEKGLPRVAAGIDAAKDKMQSFYGELLPYQDKLRADLERMPDLTLNDNIQRMVKFVQGMANFKRTK